jgi:hypothetical protein
MDNSDADSLMMLLNNRPIDDFEGFSPSEIHHILYDLFSDDCPVKIRGNISEDVLKKIPFLLQVKYILDVINEKNEIKLTSRRCFPVWLVKDIYSQGFLKDDMIEAGITKLNREDASLTISVTHSIAGMAGLTKVQNNHILLTRKGKKLLDDWNGLFLAIFKIFSLKYAWSQNDLYEDYDSCQRCFGFTLKLLSEYGAQKREVKFYGDKFLLAFPAMLELMEPSLYRNLEDVFLSCYSIRTFERFLVYFNLIEIDYTGTYPYDRKTFIRTTDIFDKVFEIE